jgi:UPF0716 family protein affecting phage T7 exclusion
LLFAAALFLIKPGLISDIAGLLCIATTLAFQFRKSKLKTPDAATI